MLTGKTTKAAAVRLTRIHQLCGQEAQQAGQTSLGLCEELKAGLLSKLECVLGILKCNLCQSTLGQNDCVATEYKI